MGDAGGIGKSSSEPDNEILAAAIVLACVLAAASPIVWDWYKGKAAASVGAKNLTWLTAGFSLLLTNLSLEQLHGQNQGVFQQGDMVQAQWESQAAVCMVLAACVMVPVYTGWLPKSTNVSAVVGKVFGFQTRTAIDIASLVFMVLNGSSCLFGGVDNLMTLMGGKAELGITAKFVGYAAVLVSIAWVIATRGGTEGVANSDAISGVALFGMSIFIVVSILKDEQVPMRDLNRKVWNTEFITSQYEDQDNKTNIAGSWKLWADGEFNEDQYKAFGEQETWPHAKQGKNKLNPIEFPGTFLVNIYYWFFNPAMSLRVTSARSPSHARRTILCVAAVKLIGFTFLCLPGLAIVSKVKRGNLVPGKADAEGDPEFYQSAHTLIQILRQTFTNQYARYVATGVIAMSVLSTMNSQINAITELICDPHGGIKQNLEVCFRGSRPDKGHKSRKDIVAASAAVVFVVFAVLLKPIAQGDFFNFLQEVQSVPQVFIMLIMVPAIAWIALFGVPEASGRGQAERRNFMVVVSLLCTAVYFVGRRLLVKCKADTLEMVISGCTMDEDENVIMADLSNNITGRDPNMTGVMHGWNVYFACIFLGLVLCIGYVLRKWKSSSSSAPSKSSPHQASQVSNRRCVGKSTFTEPGTLMCLIGVTTLYLTQCYFFGTQPSEDDLKDLNATQQDEMKDSNATNILGSWSAVWLLFFVGLLVLFVRQDIVEGEPTFAVCTSGSKVVVVVRTDALTDAMRSLLSTEVGRAFGGGAVPVANEVLHAETSNTELKFEVPSNQQRNAVRGTQAGAMEYLVGAMEDNVDLRKIVRLLRNDGTVYPLRESAGGSSIMLVDPPQFEELQLTQLGGIPLTAAA